MGSCINKQQIIPEYIMDNDLKNIENKINQITTIESFNNENEIKCNECKSVFTINQIKFLCGKCNNFFHCGNFYYCQNEKCFYVIDNVVIKQRYCKSCILIDKKSNKKYCDDCIDNRK